MSCMLHPATSEFSDRHIRQEKTSIEPEYVSPILALSSLSQVRPRLKQRSRHCWAAADNTAKAKHENYRQNYPRFQHLILATSSSRLRAENRLTWALISEDVGPNHVIAMVVRLYGKGGQNKVSDPAQISLQRLMQNSKKYFTGM